MSRGALLLLQHGGVAGLPDVDSALRVRQHAAAGDHAQAALHQDLLRHHSAGAARQGRCRSHPQGAHWTDRPHAVSIRLST